MKTLQNNFTTPEQSKQLLELGVSADSADCYLTRFGIDKDWEVKVLNNVKYSEISISNQEYCLPCWSVGRLMEIIDICANEDSSGDFGEEYPSTTKVMRKLNMDYITYLVKSIERATELKNIDFSKLEE